MAKPEGLMFQTITKLRWWKGGSHIHMSLFIARDTNRTAFSKIGELCVREDEWEPWVASVSRDWIIEEWHR